jgi:hypothetical protein
METLPTRPCATSGPGGNRGVSLRLSVIVAFVMAFLAWPVASASAAPASKPPAKVTFGVEPASSRGADGRPYFSFGVTPGALVYDHVAVLNYSLVPLTLQLYATDAVETSAGGFGLLPASVTPTGAGAWITLPPQFSTVRVPARSAKGPGEIVVPVLVHVPDRATPGDHVGGIVASLRTVGTNKGQNVILVVRVGTRVFIRVAGALAPGISLTDLHASYHGTLNPIGQGRVTVSYVVSNTGNVDLALTQSVSVSGPLADRRATPGAVPLLLPGASVRESAVVTGVWPQFLLQATVSALPSAPVGSGDLPALVSASARTSLWAIPWSFLGAIVLVLLALGLLYRARRRPAAPPAVAQRQMVSV